MFYKNRAEEINTATEKLGDILKKIAIAGLYPGEKQASVAKLLEGKSQLVAVRNWAAYLDEGGVRGLIDWLPLDAFISAATALVSLRDQAKQQMFEISGISDIMRGQGDPEETATAQNLKGRYAGMRLGDRQTRMAQFARDTLQMGIEVVFEHYDHERIIEMVNLNLPRTKQERILRAEMDDTSMPDTSWEEVFERLGNDMSRKFAINIETDSTLLPSQEEDKKARIEFLTAFSTFIEQSLMAGQNGIFPMKMAKELLLFAVRGFPKSRTIESMIQALPEQVESPPPPDVQVQVAKIRAEADLEVAKLRSQTDIAEQELENKARLQERGATIAAEAEMRAADAVGQPPAQQGGQ